MRVESFSRTSPLDPIESTELGRGQVISVGRGPLTSRHFVGFPIRCVSPNDVRVEQAMWSRAALILLISKSGGLFIFDRASRNSIVCESEWPNQSIKSFEYTPNLIMCDEEEGRDPLPHQERRPDQPNLRDTLSSFSFGSVVVKEYDREDEEC